jgi:(4-(4-[2-(gamma-L-glutamylamino)ethyl]phenoxymethyl)furan-2-yl)methanamine synthase
MNAIMAERGVIGWDIGGAHVKAALLRRGVVHDAAQWPCPLWKGLDELELVLHAARDRWPQLHDYRHAVSMTGEMVDAFEHREDGVQRIAQLLGRTLPQPCFFAGDAPWCGASQAGASWAHIASANWLATARHAACLLEGEQGVFVDIGSTTTDLISFCHGRVLTTSRSDALRLERSELVYQGVVRTPLCALARRIAWRRTAGGGDGTLREVELNVMNEFFATTADVYRLTGELDPAHDQQPSADNGPKDEAGSCARLARMIGLDARDAPLAQWQWFARAWRSAQLDELRGQLRRVLAAHALQGPALLVSAGCGAFLVPELLPARWRHVDYAVELAQIAPHAAPGTATWARVCAPSVAVAALFEKDHD